MSILSVDNISPIGSGTSVTVNSAATLVLTNANSTGVITATSFVGSGANLTGVLSNIVEDTSPQLGGNLDTNSHEISLDTSHAINFGDSNELTVKYHSGNGQIDFNGTTSLQLKTPANKYFQVVNRDNGNNIIQAQAGGNVQIYHAGSKKFETTSSGIIISGDNSTGSYIKGVARFTPNDSSTVKVIWDEGGFSGAGVFQVKDGVAFTAGDSSDLKIYHDGNDSYIDDAGVGSLVLRTTTNSNVTIKSSNDVMAKFMTADRVELYHNNSKKFETMSSGARIQGGLLFNSDTAAANTLDDYEEGTHTTTVTISGNTSFSYSSRALAYTKIGRVVHLIGRINLTNAGGGSTFDFTLPFTCGDGGANYQYETSNEFQVIRGNDTRTFRIREGESIARCQNDGSNSDIGVSSPHVNVFLTYFTN